MDRPFNGRKRSERPRGGSPFIPLVLFPLLLSVPFLDAATRPGKDGAVFLRLPVGARSVGMGEAFAVPADDGHALFWNPAGLAPSRTPSLSLGHAFYFDQTRLDSLAAFYPTQWGGAAIGTRWLTAPALPRLRDGADAGDFSPWERTAEAALAFGKKTFSVGVAGRLYQARLDQRTINALMGDAGLLKTWRKGRYRAGLAVQNMGSPFGYGSSQDLKSQPPRLWRFGAGLRPGKSLFVSLEHQKPQRLQGETHAGVEYWAAPSLALRAGYLWRSPREREALDPLTHWRFGTGLRFGGMDVDYAYAPAHLLGDVHHVSLGYRFLGLTELEEGGRLSLEAKPLCFSPNGDKRADACFFFLGLEGIQSVSKWTVDVRNSQSKLVRRYKGRGALPGLTEWDGKDADGKTAPDDTYLVQARVWGRQSQALSPPVRITMDATPPEVELSLSTAVFSPDGDGADDVLILRGEALDLNPLVLWELRILARDERETAVFSSTGHFENRRSSFAWDGSTLDAGKTVANGLYEIRLTAEDAAGNVSRPALGQVEVRVASATVIRNRLSDLPLQETASGHYRIALPSEALFEHRRSVQISERSAPLRSQIVTFAKTFPDHRILINGRVGSERSSAKRTELSSAQAWALYSALVKAGVSAVRVEVHGLGGAAGDAAPVPFAPPAEKVE